jgi:hypothetical protein
MNLALLVLTVMHLSTLISGRPIWPLHLCLKLRSLLGYLLPLLLLLMVELGVQYTMPHQSSLPV